MLDLKWLLRMAKRRSSCIWCIMFEKSPFLMYVHLRIFPSNQGLDFKKRNYKGKWGGRGESSQDDCYLFSTENFGLKILKHKHLYKTHWDSVRKSPYAKSAMLEWLLYVSDIKESCVDTMAIIMKMYGEEESCNYFPISLPPYVLNRISLLGIILKIK